MHKASSDNLQQLSQNQNATNKVIFSAVIKKRNVERAYTKVRNEIMRQNLPSPGAIELFDFAKEDNLSVISAILASEKFSADSPPPYDFHPLRLYYSLKSSGSVRMETYSSMFDRVMIQCVMNHVGPFLQNKLLLKDVCLGYWYQPAHRSYVYSYWPVAYKSWMASVTRYASEGYAWALHSDIQSFFHSIDRGKLLSIIEQHIKDERILNILRRYLKFTYLNETSEQHPLLNGLPIEEPSSRLLANIYLADFDRYVTRTLGIPYVRYVDDMIFFADSEARCLEIRHTVQKYLSQKLNLYLNDSKTMPVPITDVMRQGGRGLARRLSILDSRVSAPLGEEEKKIVAEELNELMEETFPDTRDDSRAKRFASYRLGKLEWETSARNVSRLLHRADTRKMAAIGLSVMGTAHSKALLRDYLLTGESADLQPFDRLQCFYALLCSYRNHDRIFDYHLIAKEEKTLLEVYGSHPNWKIRSLAVLFTNDVTKLAAALQDSDPSVRLAAALALCRHMQHHKLRGSAIETAQLSMPGNFDLLLASLMLQAHINKKDRRYLDLGHMFKGVPTFESVYAGQILIATISEADSIPNRGHLCFDALKNDWELPQKSALKKKVLALIKERKRSFIDRLLGDELDADTKSGVTILYSKIGRYYYDNVDVSVALALRGISRLIKEMEPLCSNNKQISLYIDYLKWQTFAIRSYDKSFVHKFAISFIGFLCKEDDNYRKFQQSYGRFAKKFFEVVNTKKSNRNLLVKAEELPGNIDDLIRDIEASNAVGDDHRFEFDLIAKTILIPSKKEAESQIERLAARVKATYFPPLGEWNINIENFSRDYLYIDRLEVHTDTESSVLDVVSGNMLNSHEKYDCIHYTSTQSNRKRVVLQFKDSSFFFIDDAVIVGNPHIFDELIKEFPKPLMNVYLKIWKEKTVYEQYVAAIDAFKQLHKYTAFLLIADALLSADETMRGHLLRRFRASGESDNWLAIPSEGHWQQIIHELTDESRPTSLSRLRSSVTAKETRGLFAKMIQHKNQLSHGAKKADRDVTLTDCINTLHNLYRALICLTEYPLIYLFNHNMKTHTYDATKLMGLAPIGISIPVGDQYPPLTEAGLHILGNDDRIIPMGPLLQANDEDNWNTALFYERRTKTCVDYLDYSNGLEDPKNIDFDDMLSSIR